MATLTIIPGQNIFNRNFKGSTVYSRNGSTLLRRKHITKHYPQNKSVFTSHLLKTSAISYNSLSSPKKQSFDDFVALNPEYKSGINVMTKINILSNYADKTVFNLIDSINALAVPPVTPSISIDSVSKVNKTVSVSWGPATDPDAYIDFYYVRSFSVPVPSSSFFGYLSRSSACLYSNTLFVPLLDYYDFISLKASYTNADGLISSLSAISYHSI